MVRMFCCEHIWELTVSRSSINRFSSEVYMRGASFRAVVIADEKFNSTDLVVSAVRDVPPAIASNT